MPTPAYKGSITTTGSSEAFRFEKSLFRQNPEFRQKASIEAHVIGPGTLLVQVTDSLPEQDAQDDPMVSAFLSFIEKDVIAHPERIAPLSVSAIARGTVLTQSVTVSDDDTIPDDVSL